MPVIKQPETVRAEVFSLGDIALEAKGIVELARRQAEQILAGARVEADRLAAEARRQGHDEGVAAGTEQGRSAGRDESIKKFDAHIARVGRTLGEAVEQLNGRKGRMLAEARQDLVALALAVAEKVVRRHIRGDAATCQRTVEAAVELAGRASRLSVRVNPSDLELIRVFAPQLAARLTDAAEVAVVADDTIESGGCHLTAWRETGQAGEVDATLATQLDRLVEELLGVSRES
jgi:flagellar assembly protein FliH